ncbi:hypothetical protein GCM10023194_81040 [Planotetraspora phitsanulokensis]|uniref:Uncharacterized protein n=1 Tax=Planotetraspora phitsanulokensis TaxID=575192 RepID=A0A8J3UDP1_9ACTN|nr:hypothetical protein [Planotetraspora phitsanulokensis]GII42947.1 hypothetical protein Pph01_79500 [Planotetraspora phitsanulokensis]
MNRPQAYDDSAWPVWVPPLVDYHPPGEMDPRGAYLLARRKVGSGEADWEALITWTTTSFPANAPHVHVKHVQWVPYAHIKQVRAEATRGRYKTVPTVPAVEENKP